MIDRASILQDREILAMLRKDFVPVAIDQWYTREQKDVEGRFYRNIIRNSPRSDPKQTTQGFYIASPGGHLIDYNNNRGVRQVRSFMEDALKQNVSMESKPLLMEHVDQSRHHELPAGGIVARVNSKVLSGYESPDRPYAKIFQDAIGRDNLWITAAEQSDLANGSFPTSLARKIVRFHLVDNTRGEPPMWRPEEIKSMEIEIDADGVITGEAHLETEDGKRGYVGALRGSAEFETAMGTNAKKLKSFDLVSKGKFWGAGRYTKRPPKGKFDFAIAIRLADGTDVSDPVLPQALKAAGPEAYRNP